MRGTRNGIVIAVCAAIALSTGAYAALTATTNILFVLTHTKTFDLNTLRDTISTTRGLSFTGGAGANQVNALWHDNRTLADGANETLDVNDGTLTDAFGDTLEFAKIKVLYMKNNSADANLLIGGDSNNVNLFNNSSDILKLPPEGELMLITPNATGVNVSKDPNFKVAHDGSGTSSLTYDIIVIGVE